MVAADRASDMSAHQLHIGIVTGETAPELTPDGQAVMSELARRGFATEPVRWNDTSENWSAFDALLVRSCWEYYQNPGAFRRWLAERAHSVVLNDPEVIRWNMHKFYLRDLVGAGVSAVPTAYVERGSDVTLGTLASSRGWTDVVVKPAIGTSSHDVWRATNPFSADVEQRFQAHATESDLLVQQFAPEITDGELSFVFFGGEFSHASRSVPDSGEFRAHHSFGAVSERFEPSRQLLTQASNVLQTASDVLPVDVTELVYARVDGIERNGEFELLELELIEPYLGLSRGENAVEMFVDAIEAALDRRTKTLAREL